MCARGLLCRVVGGVQALSLQNRANKPNIQPSRGTTPGPTSFPTPLSKDQSKVREEDRAGVSQWGEVEEAAIHPQQSDLAGSASRSLDQETEAKAEGGAHVPLTGAAATQPQPRAAM